MTHNKTRWRAALAMFAASLGLMGCGSTGATESVLPGVEALVFARRPFETESGAHNVTGGNGQTMDYLRYNAGPSDQPDALGGLYVLEPPTPNGQLRNLTADFTGVDINGLDVSFDGRRVVFSMRQGDDNRYHIWVANLDGSEIRQLTFGDQHDALPIWLPGNRIAFVTNESYTAMGTRADEYNHARVVSQLATISAETGDADRRVCSQNLSHTATLALDHDGTILYSRWEHLGPVNDLKLFRVNPDCTGMVAVAGQFNKRFNSLVQCRPLADRGTYSCIGTSRRRTIQAGALIEVDARSETSTNPTLYWDVQQARFENVTPDVPTGEASPPSGVGRYRTPMRLPGSDSYVVSWADGPVNDRAELAGTAPPFGLYLYEPSSGRRTLVYDNPRTWELYAMPTTPRDEPPVIRPIVEANPDPNEPAVIGSIDITQTSLNERVRGAQFDNVPLGDALGQAKRVRIIEGFSSEIGGVGQFGLTMHEGAAILGETPVYSDGSWRAQVPGYLPYHLQPLDEFGLAIRNQMLWIQAMPAEDRICGGCHADRSQEVQPRMGPTTIAQQVGADTSTFLPMPDRTELPWANATSVENIQDVLDRNCVSCHGGGATDPFAGRFYTVNVTTMSGEMITSQIPYLDLSSRSIQVVYENDVVTYPVSYVSLLYPSAMMGDSMATGDVPPEWVVPGNARRSRLIEAINMTSEDDPSRRAWMDRPLHPENLGQTVSRADRLKLIQMVDLGGQYYSRRNADFDYANVPQVYP